MLKFNFFTRCEDKHFILNNALNNILINNYSTYIIKDPFANIYSKFILLRITFVVLRTFFLLRIPFDLLTNKNLIIFVREFSNISLCAIYPFLYFCRNKVFFNINHNLKNKSYQLPISIKILCMLGCKFILFDGQNYVSKLNKKYHTNFITPLFPLNNITQKNNFYSSKLIIGVVGDVRPEKINIKELEIFVKELIKTNKYKFMFGSSQNTSKLFFENFLNIEIFDTTKYSDYIKFLKTIDILIIFAKPEAYMNRHSGTLMDAVSCCVIPIVPNFTIFNSQINNPSKIGYVYDNYSDIMNALDRVANFKSYDFKLYTEVRSNIQIINLDSAFFK